MSGNDKKSSSSACCVCYKNVEYYSVGLCDHPVCFECSARMRVLCQQNECPICRQKLPYVAFTKSCTTLYRWIKKDINMQDTKYKIYFENNDVWQKFLNLLAHRCNICQDGHVFDSFDALKEHMKRKHDLHYCDLCVENIKIFPRERRTYTKQELARHRRKGDPDNTSHRGHPLCEFCDKRYMDNDELYRHLRRDHLFCHFCDADGLHHYYCSYGDLRDHFRQEHYLCEEGPCQEEQFTSVFRTDIDLKAHKATVHGKQLSKHAAKQARTLELEFTLAPRGDLRTRRGPMGQNRNYNNHDGNANSRNFPEEVEPPREEQPTFVRQPLVDVQSTEEFPTLGNATPSLVPHVSQPKGRKNFTIRSTLRKGNYDENFPALGPETPGSSNTPTTTKTLNFSVSANKGATASASGRQQSATPNLSIHVNHRPNGTVMTRLTGPNLRIQPSTSRELDFPALGRGSESVTASAVPSSTQSWTKITCVKPEDMPRNKKVAPPPLASSPPPIRSGQDFPSLSKTKGKSNSQVLTPSWVQVQSTDTSSSGVSDATKGKAKKKKIKPTQQSSDGTSGNDLSYSLKASMDSKKTKPESSKNDGKAKKNSDLAISSSDDNSSEKRSFIPATPASAMRKRSELKIDNLNNVNNNNLSLETKTAKTPNPEDFPALGRRPPGLSSPPPGFTAPVMSTGSTKQPPPGFLNKSNGLTFTNSSGESYTIVPEETEQHQKQQRSYSYLPPPNFQYRNKNLIAEFNDWFKSDVNEELKAFKYLSGLYRTGVCDAEEYYKQCQTVMGAEVFQRVFPELLALLPDIRKQRELFEVHKRETKSSDRVRGLESCSNCGQILRSADLQQHASSHTLENHFPTLASSNTGPNAWSKK